MDKDPLEDEVLLADAGLESFELPLALGELAVAQAAEAVDEQGHEGSEQDQDTEGDELKEITNSLHRAGRLRLGWCKGRRWRVGRSTAKLARRRGLSHARAMSSGPSLRPSDISLALPSLLRAV